MMSRLLRRLRRGGMVDSAGWLIRAKRDGLPEQPDIDPLLARNAEALVERRLEAARTAERAHRLAKAKRAEIAANVRRKHLRVMGGGK